MSAFVSSLDRAAIAPLIIPIAADLSRSVGAVTFAASAYLLSYGVMQLVWAVISDRYGRVRSMQVALVVAGVAGIISAAAPNLALLVVARGVAGAAFAAAVPGALIYIGDTVPMRARPAALADLATAIAVGFAVGTVGAAVIAEQFNWRAPFAVIGCTTLLVAILMSRLIEPPRERPEKMFAELPLLIRDRGTLLILGLAFVEGFVVLGFLVFLPAILQLSGVATSKAGGVTAVYGVAVVIAAWGLKRVTGRISPHWILALGGVLVVAAFGLLVVVQDPLPVLVSATGLGAAWALMHTGLQAWATEASPTSRSLVVSAFAASLFTGSAVGTWVGGMMLAGDNVTLLFTTACALATLLTIVATLGRARQSFDL